MMLEKRHPGHMPESWQGRSGVFMKRYTPLPLPNQYSAGLSDDDVEQVIAITGEERLTSYLNRTQSRREAIKLYALNARLSKHIHELIGGFEVALRNAVSASISAHHKRDDWYRTRKFVMLLAPARRENLRDVRKRLAAERREERTGRIVAGLTFHFWVAMHENKYRDTVWTPHLHRLWPRGENIKQIHKDLLKIRDLRNRIAHFEPIFEDRWKRRTDIIWNRFDQIAPHKSAWYRRRLAAKIEALRQECDAG